MEQERLDPIGLDHGMGSTLRATGATAPDSLGVQDATRNYNAEIREDTRPVAVGLALTIFASRPMIPPVGAVMRRGRSLLDGGNGGRTMNIAWGIVTLALLGVESPEDKPRFEVRRVDSGGVAVGRTPVEADQISFEVRVVDTPAADWRQQIYRRCKRVGREGRSTVWTVDERSVLEMLEKVQGDPRAKVVMCPKATALKGTPCVIDTMQKRTFVVDVDRVADGPVDQAGAIAFRPAVDEITEGICLKLSGQKTAAGVRAHVVIDSTWVGNVVETKTTETIRNREHGKNSLTATMQLPQVVEAKIYGDFEMPADQELLVSLGTITVTDKHNKPVVMERLALIAARPIVTEAEEVVLGRNVVDAAVRAASAYMPKPLPTPPLPSRSPMVGFGPDGKPAPLPPLPVEQVIPASATESATPRPSPQMTPSIPIDPNVTAGKFEPTPIGMAMVPVNAPKVAAAGKMHVDPSVSTARYEPMPVGKSTATFNGQKLSGGATQTIRIPVSAKISIELKARVVPTEGSE
jgi:hypothetical protein